MAQDHGATAQGKAGGQATVRYGVYNQPGSYAGQSVQDVRKQLGKLWNIPDDAQAYKGKTKLDENYVIQPGESIDFHRKMGEKGLLA